MGIKGLPKLIKDYDNPNDCAMKSVKFDKFKGITVSVDASLLIYQTVVALRSSGKDMKNEKGELTSHLQGLFYKVLIFLQNGMIPIFVFDGKAPDIKSNTINKRKLIKKLANEKLESLNDSEDEEYIKTFKKTFKLTKENIQEAQILLDLMGIPYIIAPGEADDVCAWLAARHDNNGKRYVKGVCSDDSDMLALGASYLFKDMLKFMSKNKEVKVIDLKKTLVNLNLKMSQFVDLCVLLGCDYCDNIPGVGSKTAYKLIQKHKTLEKVIEIKRKELKGKNTDTDSDTDTESDTAFEENLKCLIVARNYFKKALEKIDQSDNFILTDDNLKLRKYQYDELMDFMCVKHNFDIIRIQTAIERLKKSYTALNVQRENTKKVHQILQPRSENYAFKALSGDFDFLSSDDEDATDATDVDTENYEMASKNKSKPKYIKSTKKKA